MKVLVVDDDTLVTGGIRTIIEMSTKDYPNPYRVVSTGKNGKEALDPYAHHQPDIVLMDIRMPI